jgi:hypothetical protein
MTAEQEKTKYYNVFVRTWWRYDEQGNRVPGAGRKSYKARHITYADAGAICKQYNDTHDPGPLSKKAEFEEA